MNCRNVKPTRSRALSLNRQLEHHRQVEDELQEREAHQIARSELEYRQQVEGELRECEAHQVARSELEYLQWGQHEERIDHSDQA